MPPSTNARRGTDAQMILPSSVRQRSLPAAPSRIARPGRVTGGARPLRCTGSGRHWHGPIGPSRSCEKPRLLRERRSSNPNLSRADRSCSTHIARISAHAVFDDEVLADGAARYAGLRCAALRRASLTAGAGPGAATGPGAPTGIAGAATGPGQPPGQGIHRARASTGPGAATGTAGGKAVRHLAAPCWLRCLGGGRQRGGKGLPRRGPDISLTDFAEPARGTAGLSAVVDNIFEERRQLAAIGQREEALVIASPGQPGPGDGRPLPGSPGSPPGPAGPGAGPGRTGLRASGFAAGQVGDVLVPGPALAYCAAEASDGGLGGLDDDELAGLLRGWRRLASWAAAGELAAAAEFARRRAAGGPRAAEHLDDEIAVLLTLTGRAASRLTGLAAGLARLPATAAALAAGRIDLPRAAVLADETCCLDDDDAAAVEQQVLPAAPWQTTAKLRAAARRAVLAIDAAAANRRRKRAEKDARVETWTEAAGTAALAGRDLPPAEVIAAGQRIGALARWLHDQGAEGTLAQLRSRVFTALLNGHSPETLLPRPAPSDDGTRPDPATPPPGGPGPGGPGPGGPGPGGPAQGGPAAGAGRPGWPGGGNGASAWPAGLGGSVNLTIPLTTWLGLSADPGEADTLGALDAWTCRDLAAALAANPGSRWCLTVTGPDGRAVAHGCARRPAIARLRTTRHHPAANRPPAPPRPAPPHQAPPARHRPTRHRATRHRATRHRATRHRATRHRATRSRASREAAAREGPRKRAPRKRAPRKRAPRKRAPRKRAPRAQAIRERCRCVAGRHPADQPGGRSLRPPARVPGLPAVGRAQAPDHHPRPDLLPPVLPAASNQVRLRAHDPVRRRRADMRMQRRPVLPAPPPRQAGSSLAPRSARARHFPLVAPQRPPVHRRPRPVSGMTPAAIPRPPLSTPGFLSTPSFRRRPALRPLSACSLPWLRGGRPFPGSQACDRSLAQRLATRPRLRGWRRRLAWSGPPPPPPAVRHAHPR